MTTPTFRRSSSVRYIIERALRTASAVSIPCPLGYLEFSDIPSSIRGTTEQERHADAAWVLQCVDRIPETPRAAMLLRMGILPTPALRALARQVARYLGPLLPCDGSNLAAVELALLRAADQPGTALPFICKALCKRRSETIDWVILVHQLLDNLAAPAEQQLDDELTKKGWL